MCVPLKYVYSIALGTVLGRPASAAAYAGAHNPLQSTKKSCILKLELVSLQPWLFSQIYLRKASATAIELPAGLTACAGAHNPSRQRNQSHVKASVFLSSVP